MNGDMRHFYDDPAEKQKWGDDSVDAGLYPTEEHLIGQYFTGEAAVLDVGCGGGREALALAAKGFDVTAIDYTPAFVDACRKRADDRELDIVVMQADAGDLPFDDEQFDHVVMVGQLLGHIRGRANRIAVLREIRRIMKPGFALISTNSVEHRRRYRAWFALVNAARKLYNPHQLEPFDDFVHRVGGKRRRGKKSRPIFHWYRAADLAADAGEAGWEVVESLRREQFERDSSGGAGGGETFYA